MRQGRGARENRTSGAGSPSVPLLPPSVWPVRYLGGSCFRPLVTSTLNQRSSPPHPRQLPSCLHAHPL